MTNVSVRRSVIGSLLIGVLILSGILMTRDVAQAATPQTLTFACQDRSGQLYFFNGESCPAGYTKVDFAPGQPSVTACAMPIINTLRVAMPWLQCSSIEQTIVLHGPTETLVCANNVSLMLPFPTRLQLARSNGTCPPGSTLMVIPPGSPVAVNDSYVTGFETLLTVDAPGVLANDTLNSAVISAFDSVSSNGGTVNVNPDGSFSYMPPSGFAGFDSFGYTLSNSGSLSSATVTIEVIHYPVAVNDEFNASGDFNGTVPAPGVLANDEVNGATITAYDATTTAGGSVSLNADGSFTYVAPSTSVDSDTFTYTITNQVGNSTATVTLNFNKPPVAVNDSATTDEDTATSGNVLTNDTDPDLDPLTVTQVNGDAANVGSEITLPSGALLTVGTDGAFNWSPNGAFNDLGAGESTSDSFTYTISDGQGGTASATVTITINGLNDSPTAVDDNYTTDEDTMLVVAAPGVLTNDTDPDTDTLAVGDVNGSAANVGSQITLASGALLTVNADGSLSWDPNGAFNGLAVEETTSDSFTYSISDGNGGTDTATVTITITGVNDDPTTSDQTLTTAEDTDLSITLTGGDPDTTDTVSFSVKTGPSNGTLSGTAPNLTYSPDDDFAGSDSFTYEVSDGNGGMATGTVSITVTAVNDAPELANIEGADLAYTENDLATQITGTLTISDSDSTTLAGATVTISSGFASGEDVLEFTDANGITGSYDAGTGVLTLTGSAGLADYQAALRSVSYRNQSDNPGTTKTITFQVDDGAATNNQSNTVSRDIAITVVNDAPVNTVPGAQSVDEDTDLVFTGLSVADVDAGANPVQITLTAENGTVTLGGLTGLTFTTGDGTADATMTFTGTLADVNAALSGLIYRGAQDFNSTRGTASMTIVTNDQGNTGGGAESDSDSVAITVNAINDAPTVQDRTFDARANLSLTITGTSTQDGNLLVGVTDPDTGDAGYTVAFTASYVTGTASPAGAVVTVAANGDLTFTAPPGYTGDVTFDYEVCDTGNPAPQACDTATVTVTVSGPVVWFVNDETGGPGNGTLANPFRNLTELNGRPSPTPTNATVIIFVYEGNYSGTITLRDNELLLGQGAFSSGFLAGANFYLDPDMTDAPAGSTSYPAFTGNRPEITSGSIVLASGNVVDGINVTAASGSAIAATDEGGTTKLDQITVTASSTANGINLSNQGGTLTVTNVIVNGSSSGDSLVLTGGNGTINFTNADFSQTMPNSTGRVVEITGRSAGASHSITFDSESAISTTSNAGGIFLDNNDVATIKFNGGVTLTTGSNAAFTATNGGTVEVTGSGNTLTTAGATALTVTSTAIGSNGLTFRSITANGGTNGIVLVNTGTTAGLTVTGNGGTCTLATPTCTGGTINGTSGANGTSAGTGVYLSGTQNVSLTNMRITGTHQNYGIRGISVTTFSMTNVVMDGTYGNFASLPDAEGTVIFNNLLGTSSIASTHIQNGYTDNVRVINDTGAGTLNITSTTIRDNDATGCGGTGCGNDGINFEALNAANMTLSVTGGTISGHKGDHVNVLPQGSGTVTVTLDGIAFTGGHPSALGGGITFLSGGSFSGLLDYTVTDNTISGTYSGGAMHFNKGVSSGGTFRGLVSNNTIGIQGSAGSGCDNFCSGLRLEAHGGGAHIVHVLSNDIHGYEQSGIDVLAGENGSTVDFDVTIGGNTLTTPDPTNALAGIYVDIGISSTPTPDAVGSCIDIGGVGGSNSLVGSGGDFGFAVQMFVNFSSAIRLPGYTGPSDGSGVPAYIQSRNPGSPSVDAFASGSGQFLNTPGGASCAAP